MGTDHRDRHQRRLPRSAVRDHRPVDHPVRRRRVRPSGRSAPHRAGSRAAAEIRCRAMGSGLRAAGPTRLRDGPDPTSRCAPSMALAPETPATFSRTLSVPQPTPVTADGLGAGPLGTTAGRPGRRAGHHPGPRRLRSGRRPRRGLRRHRRRPGDRLDGAAAGGAAQDTSDAHPHPAASPPRSPVCGSRPARRRCRCTRPWWPSTSGTARRSAALAASGPQNLPLKSRVTDTVTVSLLDWDDVIDRDGAGLRPTQTAGACRDRGAGRRRHTDRPRGCRPQPGPRDHRRLRARAGHRDRRPVRAHVDPCDRGRAAGRRAGQRGTLRPRADHVADRPAGVIGQSGAAIRRRRRGIVRTSQPIPPAHRVDAGIHRGVGSGPPRGARTGSRRRRGWWSCRKASTRVGWREPAPGLG